jgi:hypothetical protein
VGLRNASARPCCAWVPSPVSTPAPPAQTAACTRPALRPSSRHLPFPDLPRPSSTFPDLPRPSPTFPDLPRPSSTSPTSGRGRRKQRGWKKVEEGRRRSRVEDGRGKLKSEPDAARGEGEAVESLSHGGAFVPHRPQERRDVRKAAQHGLSERKHSYRTHISAPLPLSRTSVQFPCGWGSCT